MQNVSGYLDVKRDTLAGVANYDWFVGSGYDERIPTSVYANGFGAGLDDLSLHNADYDPYAHKNLPVNRQNLYAPQAEDGSSKGYYWWDDDRARADMAPIIPNQRMNGINRVGECVAGYSYLPKGHQLHGTRLSHTYDVVSLDITPFDPGNNFGLLHNPPALGPYQKGRYTVVPNFN